MKVTLLGPVAAAVDGVDLQLGGLKQRAVFALMALNAGRVVALDRLVDELWNDEPPSRATLSLQSYVARLRRVLADLPVEEGHAPQILTRPPGWVLTLDPDQVDVTRFDTLIAQARRALLTGDPGVAGGLLEEALALWTGEPLAGLERVRFAREEAVRLNELRLAATELLLQAQLETGETDSVAERAGRFVIDNPFRERGWTAYMLALYRCGRQSEALAAAARLRRILGTELGVDPSPDVRRLEEQILRQDPALAVSAPSRPAASREVNLPGSTAPLREAGAGSGLVGRDAVLADVDAAVSAAGAGVGRLLLLNAPAGLGKSSILHEVEARFRRRGGNVLRGDCVGAGAVPALWPWVTIVRTMVAEEPGSGRDLALARAALGVLQAGTPAGTTTTGAAPDASRMRLFRTVIDAIAAERNERPVAVVMDDLHWADADTLTLLSLAVDDLVGRGVLFAVATRSDEPGAEAVRELVDRLRRTDVQRFSLNALDVGHVATLMRDLSGAEVDSEVVSAIHSRTAGNPLFVCELVRLLSSERRLDAGGVRETLPSEVHEVLRHRIARLPEQTVAMLTVIATAGGPTSVALLADVTSLDPEAVLDACEAAELVGLLVDDAQHPGSFVLSHDLVRQTLEQSLSAARKLRLHARIAEALQAFGTMGPREIVDVARHLTLAAPLVGPAAAVPHLMAASDDALSRYANDQAERHLRTALELTSQIRDETERTALLGPVRGRLNFFLITRRGNRTGGLVAEEAPRAPVDLETTIGWLASVIGNISTGRSDRTRMAAELLLAGEAPPVARLAGHFMHGFAQYLLGRAAAAGEDFVAMEQLVADGVDLHIPGFFHGSVVSAAESAVIAHVTGDDIRADELMHLSARRASGSEPARLVMVMHQTWLAAMRGNASQARGAAAECRSLATRLDYALYEHAGDLIGGWADAVLGDPAGADRASAAFDCYLATGVRMLEPFYLLLLAEAHALTGATTRANDLIGRSRAVRAQTGEMCCSPRLLAWAAAELPEDG